MIRGAPDTARTLSEFHAEAPQATVSEGFAQVATWRLNRDSNPRPFGQNPTNPPMSQHDPCQHSAWGYQFNRPMFHSISCLFLRWGSKSISKLDVGPWLELQFYPLCIRPWQ